MNEIPTLITSSAPAILAKYKDFPPEDVDLQVQEAATLLNLSPRTLEKWRPKRKNLSFIRTPGGIIYKLSDVLEYKRSLIVQSVNDEVA